MANPTLVYSGTTITLPYPAMGGATRTLIEGRTQKRTLAGTLRTGVAYWVYAYEMSFAAVAASLWTDIVSLWDTAVAAGAYPTLTATDMWASANGVQVALTIDPVQPVDPAATKVNFSIRAEEVTPR